MSYICFVKAGKVVGSSLPMADEYADDYVNIYNSVKGPTEAHVVRMEKKK